MHTYEDDLDEEEDEEQLFRGLPGYTAARGHIATARPTFSTGTAFAKQGSSIRFTVCSEAWSSTVYIMVMTSLFRVAHKFNLPLRGILINCFLQPAPAYAVDPRSGLVASWQNRWQVRRHFAKTSPVCFLTIENFLLFSTADLYVLHFLC